MQRSEIRFAGGASFSQPFAELSRLFHRANATRTRECEGNERVGRAVCNEGSLQRRLFSQIESQEKIEFHRYAEFLSDLKHAVPAWQK